MKHLEPTLKITKIHHISDIQIRLIKRHKEYREVFHRLYEQLYNERDNAIIVVSGDVVHTKTELSPELVDLTHDFLGELAEICPTILMLGNHDCNMNNLERMDSLYPIVKGVNHPRLYYFKNSEELWVGDPKIYISVMGMFEPPKEYHKIPPEKCYRKVAIYHGTVNNSITDLGHRFTTGDIGVDFFNGLDMVLLGDIHKTQCLQECDKSKEHPEIWYAGSLVQQNHGEYLNHGYLTWNVETCKAEFHKVVNDYGYYTVDIQDSVPTDYSDIPAKARLRVRTKNTDLATVKRIVTDIRKVSKVQEIAILRMDGSAGIQCMQAAASNIDIRNVNIQNDLIVEYLNRNYVLDGEMITRIKTINALLNGKLEQRDYPGAIRYKVGRFEWENMFSFGENNWIDFSTLSGTVGIFAPNATGKSAILDSLSFCAFDKSSRAFKASQILNNKKEDFKCKLPFSIDGKPYKIERIATKRKYTGQIKVDVDFSTEENGVEHPLNAEERRSTDDVIRSYIGTYDDFVLTALSVQGSTSATFIDMGQSDRKDLLSRFLGLDTLEELFKLGSKEIADVLAVLKEFQKKDFAIDLAKAETDRDTNKRLFNEYNEEKKTISKQRDILNSNIVELTKELIPIDSSILDIDALNLDCAVEKRRIERLTEELQVLYQQTNQNKEEHARLTEELSKYDEEEITNQYEMLEMKEAERDSVNQDIELLKVQIKSKLEKLEHLKKHEYDPNCKYCMNNIFVKDAIQTQKELENDKTVAEALVDKFIALAADVDALAQYRDLYDAWSEVTKFIDKIQRTQLGINADASEKESQVQTAQTELKSVEGKIARHNEMKGAVEKNKLTEVEIDKLRDKLEELITKIDTLDTKLQKIHSKRSVAEATIKKINEEMKRAKELEEEYSAYEYYLDAVKRDGVPYDLITRTIPEIEQEVNNILTQVADFSIVWNLDGKNINTFIAYDDSNFWPLELTSGMERFIASIAIRVALLNVSSLPRPNFLAIDEGFGVLDAENVNNIYLLFDFLRTKFDFILVISHLDALKDMVDTAVEVTKDAEGFSCIQVG